MKLNRKSLPGPPPPSLQELLFSWLVPRKKNRERATGPELRMHWLAITIPSQLMKAPNWANMQWIKCQNTIVTEICLIFMSLSGAVAKSRIPPSISRTLSFSPSWAWFSTELQEALKKRTLIDCVEGREVEAKWKNKQKSYFPENEFHSGMFSCSPSVGKSSGLSTDDCVFVLRVLDHGIPLVFTVDENYP